MRMHIGRCIRNNKQWGGGAYQHIDALSGDRSASKALQMALIHTYTHTHRQTYTQPVGHTHIQRVKYIQRNRERERDTGRTETQYWGMRANTEELGGSQGKRSDEGEGDDDSFKLKIGGHAIRAILFLFSVILSGFYVQFRG